MVFAVLRDGRGGVVPVLEGAEASLRDVLAAALEANREMAWLAAELREENARLREENSRLRAENAEQAAELEDIRADLAVLQRMLFGRSSERSRPEPAAGDDGAGRGGERQDGPGGSGRKRVSPVAQDDDVAVIGDEDVGAVDGPAGWVLAGPWCACWRRGGQSVVTSVTAARALCSSTRFLRPAMAATRAWVARLLTARGRPRAASWMSAAASSLNRGSARPASLRWWVMSVYEFGCRAGYA